MHRKKPTKTIWVTKDGQPIHVKDMTDSHLVNTIRFLKRSSLNELYSLSCMIQGEQASYMIDNMIATYEDDEVSSYYNSPIYNTMIDEACKRGIYDRI